MNKNYKVALLCTCFVDIGIRSISSVLKKNNIKTELFFLGTDKILYAQEELNSILNKLKKLNPDIIGISSIVLTKKRTIQLIKAIKKDYLLANKKIVWGGVQATIEHDFCLKYIDIVGVGECELSFLELINKDKKGLPYFDISNFIFKYKGKKRQYPSAGIASLVNVVVKKGTPSMRKKVEKAVIVRVKKEYRRKNGLRICFEDNAVVLTDAKGFPKASEVKGCVAKEVGERYSKIAGLASSVV